MGRFAPNEMQQRFLSRHVYPWLVPALLALLAAPFTRSRSAPRDWRIAVAAAAMLQTAYVFSYGTPDPSPYFLPVLALGLAVLPAWLADAFPVVRRGGVWLASVAALALAVASALWFRIGLERAETYERFDAFIHRMWTSVPFDEGFVIWGDDMVHRLWEYQLLRGEKPRVIALSPGAAHLPALPCRVPGSAWLRPAGRASAAFRRRWTRHRRTPCSMRSRAASTPPRSPGG